MDCLIEMECKKLHDSFNSKMSVSGRRKWVPGPVIVGAGPSGLATAACLKEKGVPSLILERDDCIASLWKHKTYDRLRLHLPKQFCELPLMPFPDGYPNYPIKNEFVAYLEAYMNRFGLEPVFNNTVVSAEFDDQCGFWRVKSQGPKQEETEYVCQWLIVATGENAEQFVPHIEGMNDFRHIIHTSCYRCGEAYSKKNVLVVGCGNSGMEISLDLCNYKARPTLVVRDSVHVLPREMLGMSTFGLSMWLLKWFPIRIVDRLLLFLSWFVLGNTAKLGLARPKLGPLELKHMTGKTPVLDVGTISKIRSGEIKVICQGIKRLSQRAVEFVDGKVENFDAVILATGYKSNVPSWLKETNMFSEKDGMPRKPFPNGWKGDCGLYAVGFTRRGLLGASIDARRIAEDIEPCWKAKAEQFMPFTRVPPPQ